VRRQDLREFTALGAGTVIHVLLAVLMSNGDRLFLSANFGPHVLGLYGVASQIAFGYTFLGTGINLAWAPWIYRRLSTVRSKADMARLKRIVLLACAFVIAGGLLYGGLVWAGFSILVGKKYAEASVYLPVLLAGACLQNLYYVIAPPIFFFREVRMIAVSGLIVVGLALVCVFPLANAFGAYGTALVVFGLRLAMLLLTGGISIYLLHARFRHMPARAAE
jgi:O-antigen/teichoic acid export membrane protein